MKKMYVVLLVQFAMTLLILPGCGSSSLNKDSNQAIDQGGDREDVTVWIEEIRKEDGVSLLGYLEKRRMIKDGVSGSRHAFFVFNSEYQDLYEGMILDNGATFVRTNDGELNRIGLLGIEEGVKQILGYEKEVSFFRNGRQVYHQSE